MSPDLDIETLRLLVAVAESGSLSAAAAARGISQPAASARIRAFESRWRLAVLRRSSRGSQLTTDGHAVVSWARSTLHSVDLMRSSMTAMSAHRRAGVAVAASLTVAEHLLPRWLGELHVRRPDVQPVLHVVNSETVESLVRAGGADLGFIESAQLPTGLARKVVGRDRLVVVVGAHHPWARRRTPLRAEELAAERWVLREPGSGTRSTFESALRREPQLALEATSTTALIGAALAGVGPAVVSARASTAELETGRLVVVPTELDLLRPLTGIWRGDERLSEAAADLLSIAIEASRE
jgi:DNA-binding transcriptional LysR family regulator